MPRLIVVVLVVLVVTIGALFFLSTLPEQQPTHKIEVPVTTSNAH